MAQSKRARVWFAHCLGDDGGSESRRRTKAARAIAGVLCFHCFTQVLQLDDSNASLLLVSFGVAVLVAALAFWSPNLSLSCGLGLLLTLTRLVADLPHTANHTMLEALLFLVALAAHREDSVCFSDLAPRIVGAIFAWSAVQKIAHGAFVNGATLAHFSNIDSRFHLLQALSDGSDFSCESIPVSLGLLSKAIVILELGCGFGLFFKKSRSVAAFLAVVLMFGIEYFAREYAFGGLMLVGSCVVWRRAGPCIIHLIGLSFFAATLYMLLDL